nr:RNA-directed DNA polymerase, eukaryota [Tanacetum cinerariifolium]
MGVENKSFAPVLNIGRGNPTKVIDSSPAIVLDDECLMERDFSCSLMGKIKDINALPNLYLILSNEGFENVKLTHLGSLCVLLEMDLIKTKEKVFKHVGVGSWFSRLQPACDSFVYDERIIWISIEGFPIKAMTRNTFDKIVASWGELADVEDSESTTISYKRLCVKVKSNVTINDTIKVIVKGKISWIRVKELEPWSPNFIKEKDDSSQSDDESVGDEKENNSENFINDFKLDNEKELDKVLETSFMRKTDMVYNQASKCSKQPLNSDDPFVIYNILKKNNDASLGYKAKKGWIQELNTKHRVSFVAIQETKMENIDLFSIKTLWGNFAFDYVFSPSVGYPGGILCAWDPNLFHKDNSIVSDSFVAIKGTWIPLATKILIIYVYALQGLNDKRMLWELLGHMIDTWDGECVLFGDFNEVHSIKERHSTVFNVNGANAFNNFISMAGILTLFPSLSALYLDRHLSDHRPILMRELNVDYGPTPFRLFHSLFYKKGFDKMVEDSWKYSLANLERAVIHEEIKKAVWDYGINKSPGPGGFTFEFFH